MNMNGKDIVEMEVIMSDIADSKEKVKETMRYWQSVLDELDRRAMEYGELLSAMKAKEEEDKKRRDNVESMMKLNLRGTVFNTAKDTLLMFDNTLFTVLLSSTLFEPDINGEFFIDRCGNGFDRVLDYMSTGVLSTEGLNRYDEDCVYDNLKYFQIPHKSKWDYSKVSTIEDVKLGVCLKLRDGRFCGRQDNDSICIYDIDRNIVETTIRRHDQYVTNIIQLEDGRLCSCSYDKRIKIWNIESDQCALAIYGHTHYVMCVIQLLDGRLCSGSADNTIKIWNKDSGICELTVNAGNCSYRIVQLRDNRICSGHSNGNIKVWNIFTGVCEMSLRGHTSIIYALVVIDELRICSSSHDETIKVWDLRRGKCVRTLKGHAHGVAGMVLLLDERLCSVSFDGSAKFWNIETGVCDMDIHVSSTLRKVLQLHDGRLAVFNDSSMYILG
jgi:WD40 repeat protein